VECKKSYTGQFLRGKLSSWFWWLVNACWCLN